MHASGTCTRTCVSSDHTHTRGFTCFRLPHRSVLAVFSCDREVTVRSVVSVESLVALLEFIGVIRASSSPILSSVCHQALSQGRSDDSRPSCLSFPVSATRH